MKFVTYNIQYSLGKDGTYDLERTVEAVRGADIIALQEVTRNFRQGTDPDQPGRIAELLPDFYWIYGPPVDLDYARFTPCANRPQTLRGGRAG